MDYQNKNNNHHRRSTNGGANRNVSAFSVGTGSSNRHHRSATGFTGNSNNRHRRSTNGGANRNVSAAIGGIGNSNRKRNHGNNNDNNYYRCFYGYDEQEQAPKMSYLAAALKSCPPSPSSPPPPSSPPDSPKSPPYKQQKNWDNDTKQRVDEIASRNDNPTYTIKQRRNSVLEQIAAGSRMKEGDDVIHSSAKEEQDLKEAKMLSLREANRSSAQEKDEEDAIAAAIKASLQEETRSGKTSELIIIDSDTEDDSGVIIIDDSDTDDDEKSNYVQTYDDYEPEEEEEDDYTEEEETDSPPPLVQKLHSLSSLPSVSRDKFDAARKKLLDTIRDVDPKKTRGDLHHYAEKVSDYSKKPEPGTAIYVIQGICDTPADRGSVSIQGFTSPSDDNKYFANKSVSGWQCISNALPESNFDYCNNGRSKAIGGNSRSGCKFYMGPKGRKHCCKPDKDEENMTVGIMRAFIIFFESIGCFVVYINVGGGAVEPIMKRVQESLTPEQKKAVCVVTKSTHMYRLVYCGGNDKLKQAKQVSSCMKQAGEQIDNFFHSVVNPTLEANGKPQLDVPGVYETLVEDQKATYVISETNESSIQNMLRNSIAQAREFGRRGHTGAVNSIANQMGISSDAASSELGRRGHTGAVNSIANQMGISSNAASSEFGRRGYAGAVNSIANQMGISSDAASSEFHHKAGFASFFGMDGVQEFEVAKEGIRYTLERASTTDDKISALCVHPKILPIREQCSNFRFGGGIKDRSFLIKSLKHFDGAPVQQVVKVEPNNDDLNRSLGIVLGAILKAMETDSIFGVMNWESIKDVLYIIFDGTHLTVFEVKAALERASKKDDKISALCVHPKILAFREQCSNIRFGGGDCSYRFKARKYSFDGAPVQQRVKVEPNNDDLNRSLGIVLGAILKAMETDSIFGVMNWASIKKELSLILQGKLNQKTQAKIGWSK